jgi:hypothetical protein
MKNFVVFFEIFGKKMKTTLRAKSEKEAKDIVAKRIIFHKVEVEEEIYSPDNFIMDFFNGITKTACEVYIPDFTTDMNCVNCGCAKRLHKK